MVEAFQELLVVSGLLEAAIVAVVIMQGNRQLGDRGGNYPTSAFNAYTAPEFHAGDRKGHCFEQHLMILMTKSDISTGVVEKLAEYCYLVRSRYFLFSVHLSLQNPMW